MKSKEINEYPIWLINIVCTDPSLKIHTEMRHTNCLGQTEMTMRFLMQKCIFFNWLGLTYKLGKVQCQHANYSHPRYRNWNMTSLSRKNLNELVKLTNRQDGCKDYYWRLTSILVYLVCLQNISHTTYGTPPWYLYGAFASSSQLESFSLQLPVIAWKTATIQSSLFVFS